MRLYPVFPRASAFAGSVAENFPVYSLTAGYLGVCAAGIGTNSSINHQRV